MAYKGDTWYRKKGTHNYGRFMIHNIFEQVPTHTNYWDRHIIKDMPGGPAHWTANYIPHATNLSKYSVVWKNKRRFPRGVIGFELGLYRDGFHITFKDSDSSISSEDRFKLSKYLFDDANRTQLWTQDYTKVAPMANELFDRIDEYYR